MKKLCLIAVLAMLITTVCKAQNPGGVPISILPAFTDTLKPADVFPIVHGGATRRATIAQLATAIGASGPVGATGATGATGPTGDSHWITEDSLLYLNDTIYYVGIGTSNPQYQLDVKNSFRSVSGNAIILNGISDSLYGVPYTGIYKPLENSDGLIGVVNFSSVSENPVDSSIMLLGFTKFEGSPHGIIINPGDSSLVISSQKDLILQTVNFGINLENEFTIQASDSIYLKTNMLRLFGNSQVDNNTGEIGDILIASDSRFSNNTAINGSAIDRSSIWGGSSSIESNYLDAYNTANSLRPGIEFNVLHNNCHIDSNQLYGSSVIWNINNAVASNCYVSRNYLYTNDTVGHVEINNIMQRGGDQIIEDSIYGYQASLYNITQLGNSELNNNILTGNYSSIGAGIMQNAKINNCHLNYPNQYMANFTLFNSDLIGLNNNYNVDKILFINKYFDLSSLTDNLYNTTWIGGTTKIDNLQMQGKLVFNNTDSTTIYALPSPVPGETYYCTDCTPNDNSAGGVKVCYNGSLWKREW